ncbi:MAG TPA: hypothetical protein DCS82_11455 [Rhodospirillaceae bacterium]|nr:hypothetical protein [Rhodospirillaceae bacterium]HAA94016.1 hypothetical protein [Rhodospirillaceae bacterium]HAT36326.1 hypothetical protein [Rhodospirillaceae bacterium]|tara:strand:- start:170 stop:781 length:612 start_codon:yes stop_codon:yes gene_type:complete
MDIDANTHHYAVFPTVIQTTVHPEAERLNAPMLAELERLARIIPNSLSPRATAHHYTTMWNYNDLQDRPIFEEFTGFIKNELSSFAEEQSITVPESGIIIKEMWFNIYNKSECKDIHHHPNSLFTGVYFVKAPDGSAPLVIKSEIIDNMIAVLVTEDNEYNSRGKVIEAEPGKLVLFNSNVMHSTWPQSIEDTRVTICFTAVM